ncbi:MAG: TrbG/VirB9 family P-type conjugative transfer protein [Methylocystis sp.]
MFKVRFTYPDVEEDQRLLALAKAKAAMPNYRALMSRPGTNFDYTYKGQITAKPDFVFDDGIKTYFRSGGEVPAISPPCEPRSRRNASSITAAKARLSRSIKVAGHHHA